MKLEVGKLYEIEGKIYKLCVSKFEGWYKTHKTRIKRYYFKLPVFEDSYGS